MKAGSNAIDVTTNAAPRIFHNCISSSVKNAIHVSRGGNATIIENLIEGCGMSAIVVKGQSSTASIVQNRICYFRNTRPIALHKGGRTVELGNHNVVINEEGNDKTS